MLRSRKSEVRKKRTCAPHSVLCLLFSVFCSLAIAFADEVKDSCVECHSQLSGQLKEAADLVKEDIHTKRGLSCSDCHGGDKTTLDMSAAKDPAKGFVGKPKRNDIPAFCAKCHSDPTFMRRYNPNIPMDQLAKYNTSQHGKLNAQGDVKVAVCTSCHDHHGIKTKTDPLSPTYITNVPATCAWCHSDKEYMKDYKIPTNQMEEYAKSVHGETLLKRGDRGAPACNSCHGSHDAALPRTIAVGNVCAQCHALTRDLFAKSPHKAAHDALDLPECEVCHGNHLILKPTDDMVGVDEKATCTTCHSADSAGYKVAKSMRDNLELLKFEIADSEKVVSRAAHIGMDVTDAEFDISEARNALTEARTYVHSFSADAVADITKRGVDIAAKAQGLGERAIKEFDFRRRGYMIAVAIILAIAGLLYLKIKELDKRRNQ